MFLHNSGKIQSHTRGIRRCASFASLTASLFPAKRRPTCPGIPTNVPLYSKYIVKSLCSSQLYIWNNTSFIYLEYKGLCQIRQVKKWRHQKKLQIYAVNGNIKQCREEWWQLVRSMNDDRLTEQNLNYQPLEEEILVILDVEKYEIRTVSVA